MDPWLLTYDGFDPAHEGLREMFTTLGNGYFATRGAVPEARADDVHHPGTYVTGCHARPVGRPAEDEDLVNVPNWLPLTFRAEDGDWLVPGGAELLTCTHTLDMRHGTLSRLLRVRDDAGRITRMEQRRLVSMADRHLAALTATIVPENWEGMLQVRSALDGRVTGSSDLTGSATTDASDVPGGSGVPEGSGGSGDERERLVPICAHAAHGVIELLTRIAASGVEVALAARTTLAGGRAEWVVEEGVGRGVEEGWVHDDRAVWVRAGEEVTVEKIVALYTSADLAATESEASARAAVVRAGCFATLMRRHATAWERLWANRHLYAEDPRAQQVLNLYIFQRAQAVSPRPGRTTVEIDFAEGYGLTRTRVFAEADRRG
ncbi:hypothetical protein ACFQ08_16915 [Streptosporangium algeriense]|uniref:Glycoside hydrolase family 65 N-terminal domain-containing protein n=1 Tax=Streptosporangium algeriense TaxID=1682748 RepID=A0ABW3DST0_9ACTN